MDKKIVIIKPKSLSSKDKAKLTKAGHIVIEAGYNDITFKETIETRKTTFISCGYCGERIYMFIERDIALRKSNASFYCSHGHSNHFDIKKI